MYKKLIELIRMSFIGKWIAIRVFLRKIEDWQHRENSPSGVVSFKTNTPKTNLLIGADVIRSKALNKLTYRTDSEMYGKRDYWETSDEALSATHADCDGFSIYVWAKLMLMGYSPDVLGLIVFDGHMCASIIINGTIYVVDNGYISDAILPLSALKESLKNKKIRPLLWFNLDTIKRL